MKFFYDLNTGLLLDSYRLPLQSVVFPYKDEVPLVLAFLRDDAVVEPAGVLIIPTVKTYGEFDSAPICPSVTFVKTGTGATALWTGNLLVYSAAIDTALADDGNAANDVTSMSASLQFYIEADGGKSRSAIVSVTITNSLYRGDESFPVVVGSEGLYALAASSPAWSPTVVTLTGGGATALDGTNGVLDGSTPFTLNRPVMLNLTGIGLRTVILKAGTQATDGISYVRPANYAASTFEYVFNIIG